VAYSYRGGAAAVSGGPIPALIDQPSVRLKPIGRWLLFL